MDRCKVMHMSPHVQVAQLGSKRILGTPFCILHELQFKRKCFEPGKKWSAFGFHAWHWVLEKVPWRAAFELGICHICDPRIRSNMQHDVLHGNKVLPFGARPSADADCTISLWKRRIVNLAWLETPKPVRLQWSELFKRRIFWSGGDICFRHGLLWGSRLKLLLTTTSKHHPSRPPIIMINNFPSDSDIAYIMFATPKEPDFGQTSIIQAPLHYPF